MVRVSKLIQIAEVLRSSSSRVVRVTLLGFINSGKCD